MRGIREGRERREGEGLQFVLLEACPRIWAPYVSASADLGSLRHTATEAIDIDSLSDDDPGAFRCPFPGDPLWGSPAYYAYHEARGSTGRNASEVEEDRPRRGAFGGRSGAHHKRRRARKAAKSKGRGGGGGGGGGG